MSNPIATLVRKELIDAIRDKRSVMAGLYYALFTPILFAVVFTAIINKVTNPEDIEITITNSTAASELTNYLSIRGITHGTDPTSLKKIELVISSDFAEQLNSSKPAEVTLIADRSDDNLRSAISRTQGALRGYSSEIASLRLIARGVSPTVIQPLKVHVQDQATSDSKGGQLLGMVILTIVLSVFISGMNLAIDTSAGERERNSLALLLSHPVSCLLYTSPSPRDRG